MTTKEKAYELAMTFEAYGETDNAKQCALIAVDEIINETLLHDKTTYQHGRTGFWKEVKQEILEL